MNMLKMMKQAADLQKKMENMQAELAQKTVEFSSGGGKVGVVVRGDMHVERITIDPAVVDPNDVDLLQDLVLSAVNGGLQAARDQAAQEMSALTQGLPLPPGMKLPF